MLRAALPLSRGAVLAPAGYRTAWNVAPRQPAFTRAFADIKNPAGTTGNTKPSIYDSDAHVLPGTQSKASDEPLPVGKVSPGEPIPAVPASSTSIPASNVPLTPPPPPTAPATAPATTPPASFGSKTIPPPTPKKKSSRFFRFIRALILLNALGFGGGVAYSLYSDNFHDFFTEYVPFGEEAVLYFEEREHRRRFPRLLSNQRAKDDSPKVNIPTKSGLSWKVADSESNGSDLETKGRHMSAVDANVPKDKSAAAAPAASSQPLSSKGEAKEGAKKVDTAKKEAPVSKPKHSAPVEAKVAISASAANNAKKLPDVNEPSVFVPVSRIDPLSVKNADEPVVQDLVKILNDIITVVNADNATGKFTSTMNKAKSELASVGQKILGMKATEREAAQSQLKATEGQFESAARDLVNRLENEMQDQESRWRDELDAERQRIIQAYQERLQSEIQRSNEVKDQQLQNQLLEQAVALKKEFVEGVKSSVENERDGRLAKLSELSSSVNELESLTSQWNDVIDTNLKTQHLQVAVEAVRSRLERADRPRPFIKDLAALKEIAAEDPVVNSAIASINPAAYQRGVPTPAQLIDRFRRVADEVRKASLLPEDAGIASHAASLVLSKFMFKKQGRAVGDDVESILTRTETLLEEGSLDDAAREMNTLKGWAKTLSSDWLAEVRRVLEVRQALDVISTEARLQSLKVD